MNIIFACPACDQTSRAIVDDTSRSLECMHCQNSLEIAEDSVQDGAPTRCLICPGTELFKRKSFPQQLGVAIACLGFGASCIPWYFHHWYATFAILFATALLDATLYLFMGDLLQCYRCHAQYRDVGDLEQHPAFNLELHERYRQEDARLAQHAQASTPLPGSSPHKT